MCHQPLWWVAHFLIRPDECRGERHTPHWLVHNGTGVCQTEKSHSWIKPFFFTWVSVAQFLGMVSADSFSLCLWLIWKQLVVCVCAGFQREQCEFACTTNFGGVALLHLNLMLWLWRLFWGEFSNCGLGSEETSRRSWWVCVFHS